MKQHALVQLLPKGALKGSVRPCRRGSSSGLAWVPSFVGPEHPCSTGSFLSRKTKLQERAQCVGRYTGGRWSAVMQWRPWGGGLAVATEVPTFYMESGLHGSLPVKGGESGRHVAVKAQDELGRVMALASVSRVGAQQALDTEVWPAKLSVSSQIPTLAKITVMCNCFYKVSKSL